MGSDNEAPGVITGIVERDGESVAIVRANAGHGVGAGTESVTLTLDVDTLRALRDAVKRGVICNVSLFTDLNLREPLRQLGYNLPPIAVHPKGVYTSGRTRPVRNRRRKRAR